MSNIYRFSKTLALSFGLAILSVSALFAQGQLDLSTGYTGGSLQQIFGKLGKPPVDVSVSVTGLTSRLANGTPRNDPRGLWLSLDLGSQITEKVVVTFTFSDPVSDLNFGIRGIDREQSFSNYQDRVAIEGFDGQNARVAPSVGYYPFYAQVTDGEAAGIKVVSGIREDTYDSTFTSVSFKGAGIKQLRLTYGSGTLVRPGLITLQNIFITSLSWSNIVPVHLMYFKGKTTTSNKTQLDWATATEVNSDVFVVQRSTNLKDYVDLGKIKSAGDSKTQQLYSFIDEAPLPGVNYYRLKQIDRDGTTDFSKIIAINSQSDAPQFVIYPNPSDGKTVQLQFNNIDLSGLHLHDLLGRELPFDIQSNLSNSITIKPAKALRTGLYILSYRVAGQAALNQKLLVQE